MLLTALEDSGGPCCPVLCEEDQRPVLEPYLEQWRRWRADPIAHPQPVLPVTVDNTGLRWFSPEGARHDFPDVDP